MKIAKSKIIIISAFFGVVLVSATVAVTYQLVKSEEAGLPSDHTSVAAKESQKTASAYERGMMLYEATNYTEAVTWLKKAAEEGDPKAQYSLGKCYEKEEGFFRGSAKAIKWYRKAAEQGDVRAQHELGGCYQCGFGIAKDLAEAVRWYRKAAEQGYAPAQCDLGTCYTNGEGVAKDPVEAAEWYRKAAMQGYARAKNT